MEKLFTFSLQTNRVLKKKQSRRGYADMGFMERANPV